MSDAALETEYDNLAPVDTVPRTDDRHADTDELSMSALDEANGGLMHLAVTFGMWYLVGRGIGSYYR